MSLFLKCYLSTPYSLNSSHQQTFAEQSTILLFKDVSNDFQAAEDQNTTTTALLELVWSRALLKKHFTDKWNRTFSIMEHTVTYAYLHLVIYDVFVFLDKTPIDDSVEIKYSEKCLTQIPCYINSMTTELEKQRTEEKLTFKLFHQMA